MNSIKLRRNKNLKGRIKSLLILVLIYSFIFLPIGFAALSTQIKLDGTLKVRGGAYDIIFDPQDGSMGSFATTTRIILNGTTGNLPSPTKTGYTFNGWYTGRLGTGTKYTTYESINNSMTLYANWLANTYKLSYDLEGGSSGASAPTSANYDSVVEISNPVKNGYTFNGWTFTSGLNTSVAKYGTTSSSVNTPISNANTLNKATFFKNLTPTNNGTVALNASWTANNYTVAFDSNGGTTAESKTVTCGQPYGPLPVPTIKDEDYHKWYENVYYQVTAKDSFTIPEQPEGELLGWYTDSTYTNKITEDTIMTNCTDQTLKAHWKLKVQVGDLGYTNKNTEPSNFNYDETFNGLDVIEYLQCGMGWQGQNSSCSIHVYDLTDGTTPFFMTVGNNCTGVTSSNNLPQACQPGSSGVIRLNPTHTYRIVAKTSSTYTSGSHSTGGNYNNVYSYGRIYKEIEF